MAHEGIFCTKAEIDLKAGELVDVTAYTEANINLACLWAESYINGLSRFNWTDEWNAATINVDVKYILSELEAVLVALTFISNNMGAYNSRIEAETMLDLRWAEREKFEKLLRDQNTVKFIDGA